MVVFFFQPAIENLLNLFFYLLTVFFFGFVFFLVCCAGLNQQTMRPSTSELWDERAQHQACCVFHLSVWPGRGEEDEEEGLKRGR